jgi:hypothetical protein
MTQILIYHIKDNEWSDVDSNDNDDAYNYCDEYTQDEIIKRCDFQHDHVVGMQILVLTSIIHQK